MKTGFLIGAFALLWTATDTFGQDIPQSQVPSLVVNSFQQTFARAFDVEWEMDGDLYKVEFEAGLPAMEHEVWYDKTGKSVRHDEEISGSDLPQKILTKVSTDFSGCRIDDAKKITEGTKSVYMMELKSMTEEWNVVFDAEGNLLSKIAD